MSSPSTGSAASIDLDFWHEQGYIVIPNAAPADELAAVVDAIWRFTGKDRDDPSTWHGAPIGGGGMVDMYCSDELWGPRQSPRIYQAFTSLWDRPDLWVTINRANFNPPFGENWKHEGFIHWDMDPRKPIDEVFQGVLLLEDTAPDMGGFQCIPGSHRQLRQWQESRRDRNDAAEAPGAEVGSYSGKTDPLKEQIIGGREPTYIGGKAGDLIIWHIGLLHGNGRNTSRRPRLAQYICMTPQYTARRAGLVEGGEDLRQARIDSWQHGPWLKALAEALGVTEGRVQQWLSQSLREPEALGVVPVEASAAKLSEADLATLGQTLAEANPLDAAPVRQAQALKYGVTISGTATALLARAIGAAINERFGLGLAPLPREMTPLGRKLLGVDPWGG